MLRAKQLPGVLSQVLTDGTTGPCILLDKEGSIVATADNKPKRGGDDSLIAAIVSNIWNSYESAAIAAESAGSADAEGEDRARTSWDLNCIVLDCETGRMAITSVGKMILCLVSSSNEEFGMLKRKVMALKEALHGPLSQLDID
eukprot:TRINITY_DN93195_c0_g1_i1.p2 TRINITY_DN93195_c0_g1~~TRINITY_DN93195_c0_g1_i1.p2  ORF type:complete len:144 (-),score=29.22 TRINITY_DN93195_c0_g1_i1:60-491(-)